MRLLLRARLAVPVVSLVGLTACGEPTPTEPPASQRPSSPSFAVTGSGPKSYLAYVPSCTGSTCEIVVLRTSTNAVLAHVPMNGLFPTDIALTPDGAFAYVTGHAAPTGIVSVIRTADNTVVAGIPVDGQPWTIAITPDGAFAYVAPACNGICVIRTADNTVTATIQDGSGGVNGIAITPDGAFVYAATVNDVRVIRTADNTVVATIPTEYASDIGITPDGAFAYALRPGETYDYVIRTADNTIVDSILGLGGYDIAVTPNGAFAYVADNDLVKVVRTADNTLATLIPGGGIYGMWRLAITPDGAWAYVLAQGEPTDPVVVIRTAENAVVGTVPILHATGIVFSPLPMEVPCTFADLRNEVTALQTAGTLNAGQANALLRKLDQAQTLVAKGKLAQAQAALQDFMRQVADLQAEGVLTSAQASELTDCTQEVIGGIGV